MKFLTGIFIFVFIGLMGLQVFTAVGSADKQAVVLEQTLKDRQNKVKAETQMIKSLPDLVRKKELLERELEVLRKEKKLLLAKTGFRRGKKP